MTTYARRQSLVFEFDRTQQPLRRARIADVDRMGIRPERGEISSRIDEAVRHAAVAQDIGRAIDRKPLGDAAEIDPDAGLAEADAAARKKLDRIRHGQPARSRLASGSAPGSIPMVCSTGAIVTSKMPPERRCKSSDVRRTSKVHASTATELA